MMPDNNCHSQSTFLVEGMELIKYDPQFGKHRHMRKITNAP